MTNISWSYTHEALNSLHPIPSLFHAALAVETDQKMMIYAYTLRLFVFFH